MVDPTPRPGVDRAVTTTQGSGNTPPGSLGATETPGSTPEFDAVVVGAGPAGSAAALVLARAGRSVCLVERGPHPGSKSMYGGVLYGRVLDTLIPRWWETAPIQRWVTRRSTMVLTGTQALTVDFRNAAWGQAPYNGATTYRPDFDAWLAQQATDAGAILLNSTTVTRLVSPSSGGPICGVDTDRGGSIGAKVVIVCDGVRSELAREAGLAGPPNPEHYTLGIKEVLALDPEVIDERFGVGPGLGADLEVLGCTGDVPGGGFVVTNHDTVSVGLVLQLTGLARSKVRPEEILAEFKAHPAISHLVAGGEIVEYSAHMIPEAGWKMIPELAGDAILVAGDAAGLCLSAGLWLEGVNFAIASGAAAGRTAHSALAAKDVSASGLAGYRRSLESSFVLKDLRRFREAPGLVLSRRFQEGYPKLVCDLAESVFTVENPSPKRGVGKLVRRSMRTAEIKRRHVIKDAWTTWKAFR